MDTVRRFRNEYAFLSNFYPARLMYQGLTYYNAEAAYQAQKCATPADRDPFTALYGDEAKHLGRKVVLRSDWDRIKLPVMEEIVRAKFLQNPHLAARLLRTGTAELLEGNPWHDTFWGVDSKTGEGENHLGRILMDLRRELAENGIPEAPAAPQEVFGPVAGICAMFGDITQTGSDCIVNSASSSLTDTRGGVTGTIHADAGPGLLQECRLLDGCPPGEARMTSGHRLNARYVIHTSVPGYAADPNCTDALHNMGSLFGAPFSSRSEFPLASIRCALNALTRYQAGDTAFPVIAKCYWNALELARQNGVQSIAFPILGTGEKCFPKALGAVMAVITCCAWKRRYPDHPISITLACLDHKIFDRVRQYLSDIQTIFAAEGL